MNWDQTLTKIEDMYGALIIFIGVILMVVVMFMLGYVVMSAEGFSPEITNKCALILFHDSYNPEGYNTTLMNNYCLHIKWNQTK